MNPLVNYSKIEFYAIPCFYSTVGYHILLFFSEFLEKFWICFEFQKKISKKFQENLSKFENFQNFSLSMHKDLH